MSFDRPEGLWLLALAVPILAFHFYRGRLRRLAVPTLLFWEQVLVEEERKSAIKRLRHYLGLVLNLLALAVLTSAVSEPRVRRVERLALVVDTSAGMLAREPDGRTRLDRARAEARAWLDFADEAALYDGEGLREPLTRDLDRVKGAVGRLRVRPRGRADEMARELRRSRPDLRVVLLSGGAPVANRGWTSAVAVQAPGDRFPTLRLRAARSGGEAREERIVLRWNGETLEERAFRGEEELEIPLDPSRHPGRRLELGGAAEVAFAEPDAFPPDDAARIIVPSSAPLALIVFHPGAPDPLLMGALDALAARGWVGEHPAVAIRDFAQARGAIGEGTGVIFDRCAPPEPVAAGAILQFGTDGPAVERPVITDWDRSGPLFDGADLTHLAVQRARVLAGGRPLIESASGPIAVVSRRAGLASVTFGFSLDLAESDFAFRAAFPIFLHRWVEWVRRDATRAFPTQAGFGEPLAPGIPWLRDGVYEVTGARGTSAHVVRGGLLADPIVPEWPGIYRISVSGREEFVAVNAFDPDACRAGPAPAEPVPPPRPWWRRIPYAALAAAVVLGLLVVEWFLYHRGWI